MADDSSRKRWWLWSRSETNRSGGVASNRRLSDSRHHFGPFPLSFIRISPIFTTPLSWYNPRTDQTRTPLLWELTPCNRIS